MKLPRPHIPLTVQLKVALRQLFGSAKLHLDHDPPLMLRDFNPTTGTYTPDANDPDYLVWRTAEDHRIKTWVRGDGAQLCDAAKRRKLLKRKRKATRPKRSWPTRKLRSRPMRTAPP